MRTCCVWRPSVGLSSCRGFRVTRFPGLRRGQCSSKRFVCSDATPSSSTWSSGGSSCTGGWHAKETAARRRFYLRWVFRLSRFCKPAENKTVWTFFWYWHLPVWQVGEPPRCGGGNGAGRGGVGPGGQTVSTTNSRRSSRPWGHQSSWSTPAAPKTGTQTVLKCWRLWMNGTHYQFRLNLQQRP